MSARQIGTSWWVDFRHGGTRYRKRSPDNSKAGAQAYEAVLRQRLARGEPIERIHPETSPLIFEAFVAEWMDTYVRANCKHSEILAKESVIKHHLIPFFGRIRLSEIGAANVERYKAEKTRAGLSPKTVNNHLSSLSKCLNCAHEWGRMASPPPKIKRLKVTSQRIDFLSPIESARLIRDDKEPMWNSMILTALRTGMRLGELLGLEWSDIDWERGIVTVSRSLVRGVLGTPKNGKIRHIPLAPEVREALAARRKIRGRVFDIPEGSTQSVTRNALNRICKRTGVRKIYWHLLRHTFASHLAMEGTPLPVVQQLLGHATIAMTMRYAHLSPSKLYEAVAVFDALEKRELSRFGQQVGNAVVNRAVSEFPIVKEITTETGQQKQKTAA